MLIKNMKTKNETKGTDETKRNVPKVSKKGREDMKLSLNFVKDYIDLPEDVDVVKLAEDMTAVGNEYDSAEPLINASNLVI